MCHFWAIDRHKNERIKTRKVWKKYKRKGRENGKEGMRENGKHEMLVLKSVCSSVEHLI